MGSIRVLAAVEMDIVIFIVDYDAAVRAAVSMLLRSCGWQASAWAEAGEFLRALDSSRPSCVLLDLQLPSMNGVSLHRELVDRGIEVPVIFLTTVGDHPLVEQALQNGAATILSKPFRANDLIEAISVAIPGPGQQGPMGLLPESPLA